MALAAAAGVVLAGAAAGPPFDWPPAFSVHLVTTLRRAPVNPGPAMTITNKVDRKWDFAAGLFYSAQVPQGRPVSKDFNVPGNGTSYMTANIFTPPNNYTTTCTAGTSGGPPPRSYVPAGATLQRQGVVVNGVACDVYGDVNTTYYVGQGAGAPLVRIEDPPQTTPQYVQHATHDYSGIAVGPQDIVIPARCFA